MPKTVAPVRRTAVTPRRSRAKRRRAARGGPFAPVEAAVEAIRRGEMVIVVDDEDRENEGDLTIAAEKVTPEIINFMMTHGPRPHLHADDAPSASTSSRFRCRCRRAATRRPSTRPSASASKRAAA